MEFKDIVTELDNFKDSDDYNNYVTGLMTDDRMNKYLESENGKKTIQPKLDSYFSKGLETWKQNNLSKLVDEEIQKRNPSTDPKDIELNKVKNQLEQMKTENLKKDLTANAIKYATSKNLPVDMVDFLVGTDEDSTNKNLKAFEKAFQKAVDNAVNEKLKSSGHTPSDTEPSMMDGVEKAFYSKNPQLIKH
ncbi:MAG: DUF4355 domain-containing protein [Oscillospiraceae bacterium]|nr:DUF4355 domain-containing protein [Oscillospiraceae bacterium]